MAPPFDTRAELIVVGTSFRTGTAMLRDRLFTEEAAYPATLEALRESGIGQALVLSTCDRSEVLAVHAEADAASERIVALMATRAGIAPTELSDQSYRLRDRAALRHLFAVAASLDSQVIGEPQILGQLKASHRIAREAGMIGGELETALQGAYRAAKRVRSETALAEQPVSIAAVAVRLARTVHGDLKRCGGLVIGTGDMGELMAESLRKAGLGRLTIAHSSLRRAELAARRAECHFLSLEALQSGLETADIVVGAFGSGRVVVSAPAVQAALKARRSRPMLFLDAGVPGDFEPAIGELEEAFLYDLDDLERLAMAGRSSRTEAAGAARAIVDEEVAAFLRRQDERAGGPPLIALRRHFERIRAEVLATVRPDDAEAATRLLVNRLLHDPAEVLRAVAAAQRPEKEPGPATVQRLLCTLFGLTDIAQEERPKDLARPDGAAEEDKD